MSPNRLYDKGASIALSHFERFPHTTSFFFLFTFIIFGESLCYGHPSDYSISLIEHLTTYSVGLLSPML